MTINESDKLGDHNGFHGAAFAQVDGGFLSHPGNAANEWSEKEPLSQQEEQRQLKYWTDQLLLSRPAEFICDMPRRELLSGRVDQGTLRIEGSLYNKMRQYCESQEVSPFTVLLAAFRAAHYRLTGMEDATVGVPKEDHRTGDSRNVADVLHKFQCFRLIVDNETFQDLTDQIKTTAANMSANRDVSMEKVAARLGQERDFLRQPLMRVAFSFYTQDAPPPGFSMSYDTDLSFQIFDSHNSLECCAVFSKDLYEKGTVNNILTIFRKTLEGCLYAPITPIKEITLLGIKNFETLDKMGLIRAERTYYPRELSVVDVFRQQVSANPTRISVKDRSGSVTYFELDERSNKIASWLLKQSLAPETLIGVLSPRCYETVIAFLGILKANLAYLPLDTKTPDYRIKSIISCMTGRKVIFLGPETEASNDLGEIEYVRISQVLQDTDENKDILCEPTGHVSPSATSLAHVLFTSGSTGQPKGVMIDHRGIVRLAKSNIMAHVPSRSITAHISNIAFDAATWEIYSAILNGGTLVCIDEMTVLDYASMSETCIRENVQTALFTTALFKAYAQNAPELVARLNAVFIGGERLDINDLPTALKAMLGKIINLYGPTENTTVSTMYCLQETEHCSNGVPIGRAISNSGAVVMDSKQCLVPLGVIGELVVFGDGLARGYLNPKLDDGHFIMIQIGNELVRGYRTGDHVRQRLDGQLEFLGRIDGQVKIRGQRVELREVECALRGHKLVHDAVAILLHRATNGDSDTAHIAGFVTISADLEDETRDGDENHLVSTWKDRYDADSYTEFDNIQTDAYGRDFTGWTSMFDGKDIDKAEMNEWLDDTIVTILNGEPPGHVLEVGSGSGMILFNIRDGLQSYVGLDPSERAIDLIGKISKSFPELNNKVTMYKATAADVRRLEMANTPPNLVILNSVAQHFPSQEYLYRFVEDLLQIGTDMTLFFGDIRSYALHKDFLAARVLRTVGEEVKLDTIRHMVADMERAELELLVDPAFFTGLALRLPDRIEHVEIMPKKMSATNELSCYRYAAVVHVKAGSHHGSAAVQQQQIRHIPQSDWIDFMEQRLDRESLLRLLRASFDSSTSTLAIGNIPYTKTILERHMVESIRTDKNNDFDGNWVSYIRQRSETLAHLSVTDLHALAEEVGCSVEVSWARQYSQRGGLDAVFHKYAPNKRGKRVSFNFPTDHQNRPYQSLSSHPLKHQIQRKTQEQLYELVKTQLPQYMVPQTITILDKIPVNENGKVNRRALVNIIQSQITERASIQQPTSEVGRQMQVIWAKVLHMEPQAIGINDNFFNLGGNSISAMKVVAAARDIGWKLSVADIFYSPTLSELSMTACMSTSTITKIPVNPKIGSVAQSFAQERLWFLEQLYPGLAWHLIPCAVHFRGPLQLDALASAFLALEQRHETLRTTFDTVEGENVQKVHPFQSKKLRVRNIDTSQPNSLVEALHKEQTTPFDLRKDPGWRVSVLKLGDEHHVLSIVIHHIICDGWSLDVLRKELATLYRTALHGKDPLSAIELLSVQYSDYALWQRQQDQIDEHNRQLEYWTTQLQSSRPAELLCDKVRPATISGRADLREFRIEGTIYENLHQFCKDYQVTPFMVLFAVFRAAHYRLTGVEDATIGTANAGRDRWELNAMIGLFVNMQCIRTKVENTTTFVDLIREVQATTIASFAHQDVPFEKIVSALRKERDLSRNPLVQIVFALHSQLNLAEFALEGVEAEPIMPPITSRFDLEFHLYQEKDALKGQIMFSTDLFSSDTIDNLKSVFLRILDQRLASPSTSIESLPLMTNEEYAKLNSMRLLDIESTNYPRNHSVIEVFQQQAAATPDKVAVRDGPTSLTYSQLEEKSNCLAQWLRRHSFAAETLVGVLASRSHLTIIAYLGVLKACLAYLPLDPTSPLSRTKVILSSVKDCRLILVGPDAEDYAKQLDDVNYESITNILEYPIYTNAGIEEPLTNPFPSPDNLAYVMFTSGSTGQPKGVMIQHRGILRLIENKRMVQEIPDAVNTAHMGSVIFDASTWEIYPTLLNGGTLVCFSSMELLDYKTLPKAFADESIQAMFITPALLRQYLIHCPDLFRGIHTLHIGGDRFDRKDAFTTTRLIAGKAFNCYGPTENTCISTYFHISSPASEDCVNGVPIGRAFPNSGAFVMDSRQQLVPLGVVGELVVTGDGLARGYIDPDHNLDRFISIKVAGKEMRAYRTGDYARYRREDAQLEFLGRMDTQIKIRGQRLELGEIEHAMLSHRAVNEAAVVIRKGQDNEAGQEATIDGFITLSEDDSAAQEQVLEMLRRQLPSYMVPRTITVLEKMPINSSGKIDRQALAKHRFQDRLKRSIQQQPSTEVQRQLQSIWAKVLAVEPSTVGLDDNFFLLGGSSIDAMKVSGEARENGIELSIIDIFGRQTLRGVAEQASVLKSREDTIPCLKQSGHVEQSFAQERLWFLDQLHSNLQWYMMPLTFRLRGSLQYNALEAALQAMERRHDTLRTTFESNDGINMQLVHDFQPHKLKVTEIPSSDQDYLTQMLEMELTRPFDLGTEPGWRVRLFRCSDDHHMLSIIMHHIISDGWSVDILQRDMAVFYSAALRGDKDLTSFVDPLPIQYTDYSVWQKQQDQVENHQHQLNFWIEHLQSSNPAELLCDKPRPQSPSGAADVRHIRIDGALYHDLQTFSKLHGITPSAVLLAAFRISHYRLTGATDATIGIPNANRNRWEVRNLIGFFVNMQCIRTLINGQSFATFVNQVRDEMLLSFANQDVPFEKVVASLEKDRDLSRHPLVQIVFALHSQRDLRKLKLESIDSELITPSITTRFDLEFHFFQEDEALQGQVIFSTDLYYSDTISNMIAIFRTTLELGIASPTTAIDSMPLLRDNDLLTMRQLGISHIKQTDYPRNSSIIDVFSQQVVTQANKVAVKDSTSQLSYTELDERSTLLASWLARRALAPETLVGVLANRSCLTIVAFLGIMKANLAYLPLDTRTPVGRMETILSSIPGRRLVLLGPGVARPTLSLPSTDFEFASIEQIIDEMIQKAVNPLTLARQPSAKSLAYVMFTSGSTGMPKGVMIEHRNILRTAEIATEMQHLLPELVIAHASNIATLYEITDDELMTNGVPIGRPLRNSGAHVVDSQRRVVPLGVIGELLVTGDGLARGYLNTQQNEGRFVSFKLNGETTRGYLTGDYARYRSDGQLEYMGRKDGQIKIRGQRVELGEIEHTMRTHRSVDDAAAILIQQDGGDKSEPQIAGYVTLRDEDDGEAVDDKQEYEQVREWEERFDVETYELLVDLHPEQLGRDFVGWTSMYDGENIDKTEMNEWLNDTINAILGSNPAEHVLEIGSGSGMILFNLTGTLKSYVGLDPSERAVNMISSHLESFPALKEKTKIYKATAADVNRLEAFPGTELAILNSVVQYFPSQDYLFRVIQNLVSLSDIKTIFLGDIRSYALHKDFLVSRALHLSDGHATPEEVARIISDMEQAESELLVDPAFFTSLPSRLQGIKHVEILPKRMHATNELSCYRYAAVLHLTLESGREVVEIEGDKWMDFEMQGLNAEALKKLLQDLSSPSILPISNIPNAKTILERHIVASVSDKARNETSSWLSSVRKIAASLSSLSAIDLASIAQDSGYQVQISWARQQSQRGGLDAVFYRDISGKIQTNSQTRRLFRFPTDHLDRSYHSFTSHPLKHYLRQKIRDEIKDLVRSQLPHYMVPHVITVIDQMPINENGKVDRRSLVKSIPIQRTRAIAQPTSDNEREMQRIWADVLNIAPESIGTNDSFFFLGGSSIAAMKVVAGAGKAGYELSVADIFRTPKLGELVSCSFQRITKATKLHVVNPFELFKDLDINSFKRDVSKQYQLQPAKIIDAYPCTPLQEGLLALTSKRQGDYVMQAVFSIQPGVVVEKLRQAWETVYKVLPLLRTRIVEHVDLGIVQVVIDESLPWVEATNLEEYLETLREIPMGIGQPLSAFAVVNDTTGTPKWLVCTMHHALYDGWSLSLIMDAVGKAYRDKQIELGSQFQAFIKFIKEQDETQTIDYWETSLKGYDALPFPALPSSVTEARTDTFIEHTIPLPQTRSDITTSSLIGAAWALVISRMTNMKDVVFGAIVSGRNAPVSGIDTMAAPTFAAVPIRIKLSNSQHVSAYLRTVQQQATDMIPFEQYGLSRISHTSPGAKAACKFQTILVIQPEEMSENPDILGKLQDDSHNTQRSDPYGISLQVQLGQERILVSVGYDSRVIEPWMMDRLLVQLQSAMYQLNCAGPSHTLSEVDLATPEDLEQIWKWNATVPPPVERCIHDIIEDMVIQSPTAEAICAWDGTLTYKELSRLSTKLAVHLLSLEVGPSMTIPLFFEKSMWTTVAMLGVLKSGAAFALLDHSIPDERLQTMLSKITTKLMLSSKALQDLGSKLATTVLAIDSAFFANLPKQSQNLPSSPSLSSPMYAIFTSGSTGTPKGVMISHGAFSSAVHYQSGAMGYDSSTRAYDFTGYAFDVAIGTAFMTLASGGCLCVPSDADRKNNLTSSVIATKANHLDLTPSVARTLQRERLVDLKVLILGGEAASHGDFQGWPKGVSILNLYGPCECTPTSTIRRCSRENTSPSNIGFGMGTVTWVTDPDNSQRLSPIGAIGELVLEGPLVGLGYLGELEKTESVFINDPAWLLHGASGNLGRKGRLYKTGDLVRYSSDGSLEFVGRKDTQVKIRGQRVELGEIETRLRNSVPNLKDVAVEVIARRDGAPSDRLVAFISFDEQRDAREDGHANGLTENSKTSLNARLVNLPEQVEDVLSASLPGYMIPTAYFALDHIPTTHSGKTDRRLLRKMGSTLTATHIAESSSVPSDLRRTPSTELERLLHSIWAQVLGIDSQIMGVDDSFFRLGGDSILAMRISAIARAEGIDISTSDIFKEKTIAKLAAVARVQEHKQGSSLSSTFSSPEAILSLYKRLPPHFEISSVDFIEDILPCIAIQERMLEARARNLQIYVTELGLEIMSRDNGSVEFQRIQQAWQAVVRHHGLLRAVFIRRSPEEGGSYQIVLKDPVPNVSLMRQEFKRSEPNQQMTGASFSDSGLQHHLSVYQTDVTRAYLHFQFNHALADGQSFDILVRDFQLAYDNRLGSHCPPYSRFLQYVMTQSHEHEQSRHHWANYMDGIEPCFLPASTQPAMDPQGTFIIDVTDLDAKQITKFCADREVSLANILQVAWALVLRRWTGSRTPCFGNIVSARDIPVDGVNEMMGPLFYLMPSQIQLDDDCAVLDILRNAHEEFVQNVKHQAYSMTQLWRDLGARGSDKMFNTALSIARHTSVLQETGDGHTFEVRDAFDPVEYAVYIRGALGDERVYLSLEFWEEHTSRADGRKMAAELGKAASLIVSHPECDIQSLANDVFGEGMEFTGKSMA
ncbi:hypothetical protein GGI42DRAFT_361069 [Trichoderma sp. SZMC 28013]